MTYLNSKDQAQETVAEIVEAVGSAEAVVADVADVADETSVQVGRLLRACMPTGLSSRGEASGRDG